MPKLSVSVPFQIPQDEALRRIQTRIAQIKAQDSSTVGDLSENWNGYVGTFSGSARGVSVVGILTVNPSDVTVEIPLPFIALPFKGLIETRSCNELTTRWV